MGFLGFGTKKRHEVRMILNPEMYLKIRSPPGCRQIGLEIDGVMCNVFLTDAAIRSFRDEGVIVEGTIEAAEKHHHGHLKRVA